MPDVSFVIPCLNEETTIGDVVHSAVLFGDISGHAVEVLVVDNGSEDSSAERAAANGAKVLSQPARGYGSAIRMGIEKAQGDVVVIADADGQHPILEAGRLIEPVRNGSADMVVGVRRSEKDAPSSPWLNRRIGTPALSAIGRLVSGAPVTDFHCGYRAIRRNAWDRLSIRSTGMEFATEMIIRAHRAGLRIEEREIIVRPSDRPRGAHLRPFRDGLRHLGVLAKCRLTTARTSPIMETRSAGAECTEQAV